MAVDLICPECGGVIGATGIDAEGRGPCTCYQDVGFRDPSSSSESLGEDDSSDTVVEEAPATIAAPKQTDGEKRCIVCGKNVSGHRRVKDSRGYLCYDCAKAEMKQEREGTIPCAECGRRMKEAGLVVHNGQKICRSCYETHKERLKRTKKISTKHYDAHEKRTLIILAAVFVALGLIVLWRQLMR